MGIYKTQVAKLKSFHLVENGTCCLLMVFESVDLQELPMLLWDEFKIPTPILLDYINCFMEGTWEHHCWLWGETLRCPTSYQESKEYYHKHKVYKQIQIRD
jgi:hypothetical protein